MAVTNVAVSVFENHAPARKKFRKDCKTTMTRGNPEFIRTNGAPTATEPESVQRIFEIWDEHEVALIDAEAKKQAELLKNGTQNASTEDFGRAFQAWSHMKKGSR